MTRAYSAKGSMGNSGMNKLYRSKSNFWLRKELERLERHRRNGNGEGLTGRIIMLSNALHRRGELTTK